MTTSSKKIAIIIGAGPAGLTAALELLRKTDIKPIILEADSCVGGISRTVQYKGNRIDIGGHRFFSKSEWVMNWWKDILPLESDTQSPESNLVFLLRNRLSRIYYLRSFFDYPIKLSFNTVKNLGLVRMFRIGLSYIWSMCFPLKKEVSLEDFLINRFGKELYLTFFKDYTEKVWGVPCSEISAGWGAQRIKGLSIKSALKHAFNQKFHSKAEKDTNTSLIEQFLYPKYGPGQMWEEVAEKVTSLGGEILKKHKVTHLDLQGQTIQGVTCIDTQTGQSKYFKSDYAFSTMPVTDLVTSLGVSVPMPVTQVSNKLPYRDFITVGILISEMSSNPHSNSTRSNNMPPDNWIYIQENDVHVGRLQIFNNWSPSLVSDESKIWMGLEFFCNEGDKLWSLSDEKLKNLAAQEIEKIGLIESKNVEDSIVIRVPKAYPAYFGAYSDFHIIQNYLDKIENLFLIGRNGMHRYNNMDHSMLTAKTAVNNILENVKDKQNIWSINIDDEYHEEN